MKVVAANWYAVLGCRLAATPLYHNKIMEKYMSETKKEIRISPSLELWVKRTLVMANVAIFLGIIFAVVQYFQAEGISNDQKETAENLEKRKNAIEVVNKVYNSEFINSYAKLKGNKTLNNIEMTNASNLVFNTYYAVAIVYNNDIADNKIIRESIMQGILEYVDFPVYKNKRESAAKKGIDQMVNSFNNSH